jgi:hypothetical protein
MTAKSIIEQGTGLMPHKCALALAAMLIATPALAIETQPPTEMGRNQAPSVGSNQHVKNKAGPKTVGKLRPPAKVPSATEAKLEKLATTSAKHAKPAATSEVAKSKTTNCKLGVSNHRNANQSKQKKLSKGRWRSLDNKTPADITGSIPPRSVLPALY